MPRQIDQTDAYRQGDNAEYPQLIIAEFRQFLRHAADKGRGQRIGQPLHYKHKSDRQKEHAHWRSPFNQLAGAGATGVEVDAAGAVAGADAAAVALAPAALLK